MRGRIMSRSNSPFARASRCLPPRRGQDCPAFTFGEHAGERTVLTQVGHPQGVRAEQTSNLRDRTREHLPPFRRVEGIDATLKLPTGENLPGVGDHPRGQAPGDRAVVRQGAQRGLSVAVLVDVDR